MDKLILVSGKKYRIMKRIVIVSSVIAGLPFAIAALSVLFLFLGF